MSAPIAAPGTAVSGMAMPPAARMDSGALTMPTLDEIDAIGIPTVSPAPTEPATALTLPAPSPATTDAPTARTGFVLAPRNGLPSPQAAAAQASSVQAPGSSGVYPYGYRRHHDPHGTALVLGITGGALAFDGVRSGLRATNGRKNLPALHALAAQEQAAVTAPRSAEQALSEAANLLGKSVVRADIPHHRGVNDASIAARVTEVGTTAFDNVKDASLAAELLQPTSATAVLRAGDHYVPLALNSGLPDVQLFYRSSRYGYGTGHGYGYSSGYTRDPGAFDKAFSSAISVPYDRFTAMEPGIVSASADGSRPLARLGNTADVAAASASKAIRQAPWRVPLEIAGAAALVGGAIWVWHHANDTNSRAATTGGTVSTVPAGMQAHAAYVALRGHSSSN